MDRPFSFALLRESSAPAFAPLLAALVLAPFSGGYFALHWAAAGAFLLAALILLLAWGPPATPSRLGALAVAGLAMLALLQVASMAWADEAGLAFSTGLQTFTYATAVAIVLWRTASLRSVFSLAVSALAVVSVVTGYALASRLLPEIAPGDVFGPRLATWLSYWNALGAMAAIGVVLAVSLIVHSQAARSLVGPLSLAAALNAMVLSLTESRGALVALIGGLAVAVGLARRRVPVLLVTVATVLPALALVVAAGAYPSWAAVVGVFAVSFVMGLGACAAIDRMEESTGALTAARLAALVVSVAVGLAVIVRLGGPVGVADKARSAASSFTSFDFGAEDPASLAGVGRALDVGGSGRWQEWVVAVKQGAADPVVGAGAGGFRFAWTELRPYEFPAVNAHSALLEAWGDTGLLGVILIAIPAVALALAVGTALLRGGLEARRRDSLAACTAGTSALLAHSLIDWTWQVPSVMLVGATLAAGAFIAATQPSGAVDRVAMRSPQVLVAAVATAALVAMMWFYVGTVFASEARAALRSSDAGGAAVQAARRAAATLPFWAEPRLLEARALVDLGDPAGADHAYAGAAALSPRDASTWSEWGSYLLDRGETPAAAAALARAREGDPLSGRIGLLEAQLSGEID